MCYLPLSGGLHILSRDIKPRYSKILIFLIHFLILPATAVKNYHSYLPKNQICEAWRCTVTSVGRTCIPPNGDCCDAHQPHGHGSERKTNHVVQAYKIVLVTEGDGFLETAATGNRIRVDRGQSFVLFPGSWHSYAPDPQTGWVESWIECSGDAFNSLHDVGFLRPEQPIFRANSDLTTVFANIHRLAISDAVGYQPVLSALGLQLLALLCRKTPARRPADLVEDAKLMMMRHAGMTQPVEEIARELGISYSYFRKKFLQQTGGSAKQYQLGVRIQRACEMLAETDQPIKSIASILGFSSAYHFSTQFGRHVGQTPSDFRASKRQ